MQKLVEAVQKKGPVCVGLSTQYSFQAGLHQTKERYGGRKDTEFNCAIIDATEDIAGCFKLQIACYEALGLDGMQAFAKTLQYARSRGNVTITDAKSAGTSPSTAVQYATAHFSGDFETDVMTINVFMGEDAVSPYYPYLEQGKGVFALVKTSNPSGKDFQDLIVDGETLYERTARLRVG
ncbi:MAG: orotidine-5'-phosphate decarboxylase [Eubacteriales bacterium]